MSFIRVRRAGMLVLVFILFHRSASSENTTEDYLLQTLFNDYNTYVRPVRNPSESLEIHLGVAMRQIIDVDERYQILTAKVWMRLYWYDFRLIWNPTDYSNISSLRIAPEILWRPDIIMYNDIREAVNYQPLIPAVAYSDGLVFWGFPTLSKSSCDLKVDYFPWDQQTCELQFGSWTYDKSKLDIKNRSQTGDMTVFTKNGEWEVIGFPIRRHVVYYQCCPHPFTDVTFYIIMRRKPLYYLFNLILPCIFLTVTTVLVFYLPTESGEKISLSVTVLLALTVFLLLVAETLPTQSDSVPLIAQYFGATIVLLAISTALTVVVLNIHHRGSLGNPVPSVVQLVVLDWLARVLRMRKTDTNRYESKNNNAKMVPQSMKDMGNASSTATDVQVLDSNCSTDLHMTRLNVPNPDPTVTYRIEFSLMKQFKDVLCHTQQRQQSKAHDERCRNDWMMVARVIDRLLLLVFALLTIVVNIALLLNQPTYGYRHVEQPLDTLD